MKPWAWVVVVLVAVGALVAWVIGSSAAKAPSSPSLGTSPLGVLGSVALGLAPTAANVVEDVTTQSGKTARKGLGVVGDVVEDVTDAAADIVEDVTGAVVGVFQAIFGKR